MDRIREKEVVRRRRNDVFRIRAYYRRMYRTQWVGTLLLIRKNGEDADAWLEQQIALRERTGCPCSCTMCGHRREHGEHNGLTMQERKFLDSAKDQDEDRSGW